MSVYSIIKECMVCPFGIEHPWFNMGILRESQGAFVVVVLIEPPVDNFEPLYLGVREGASNTIFTKRALGTNSYHRIIRLLTKDEKTTTEYLNTPVARELGRLQLSDRDRLMIGKKRMESWRWDFEKYKKADSPYDNVIRAIEHAVDIVIAPLVLNDKVEKLTQALKHAQMQGG